MDPKLPSNGKLPTAQALRLEHDETRAELTRATLEDGCVGTAARELARLSLPHLEQEEKIVFPLIEFLHDVASGDVRPELAGILPLIDRFSERRDSLRDHHRSMVSAIYGLRDAAQRDGNREVANFAHHLWLHEQLEDEVVFPTVILMGRYIRQRLAM